MSSPLTFFEVGHVYRGRKGTVQALKNISFDLAEGEVFGFVGPNGAGKSTTIKVLLDIINDYVGHVEIFGVDARRAEARRELAFVPEMPALYEQFTALESLDVALNMYGAPSNSSLKRCMAMLERLSVAKYANRKIRELSKGNVQRVALAHALVVEPRLLILDEPLSGLDPVGRKDVVDILHAYKKQGGSIFFTSHVLHDVERIADRFGFINKGELITVRSPRELAAERADCLLVRYHLAQPITPDAKLLRDGEYESEVMQADLPAFIAQLNQLGGHLLTIKPAVSLETVFFKILNESSQSVG